MYPAPTETTAASSSVCRAAACGAVSTSHTTKPRASSFFPSDHRVHATRRTCLTGVEPTSMEIANEVLGGYPFLEVDRSRAKSMRILIPATIAASRERAFRGVTHAHLGAPGACRPNGTATGRTNSAKGQVHLSWMSIPVIIV
jgi:hypothetical protein